MFLGIFQFHLGYFNLLILQLFIVFSHCLLYFCKIGTNGLEPITLPAFVEGTVYVLGAYRQCSGRYSMFLHTTFRSPALPASAESQDLLKMRTLVLSGLSQAWTQPWAGVWASRFPGMSELFKAPYT